MTFTAIVTAHAQDPSKILGNLMYQTRKPDEIIVLYSDLDAGALIDDFRAVPVWVRLENRNDWGHEKRAFGLRAASGDAIGFFNADDSYTMDYVERMMAEIEAGADAAFCSWNRIPHCDFALGSSTSGNFIFRTGLGRAVGYTDRHYEADGTFINKLRENAGRVARVDEVLYFHNHQ